MNMPPTIDLRVRRRGGRDIQDWAAESLRREYEADELAALLLLRGLDESAEFVFRALAGAGPFVVLALDHLITRVQHEIYELPEGLIERTHPPSDERAAALRAVFMELEDPNTLQFADAAVSWLPAQEDKIIDTARRLLEGSLAQLEFPGRATQEADASAGSNVKWPPSSGRRARK
jgi:hypothetical protein